MNDLVRECFSRVWAMEPDSLRRLVATLEAIPQPALDVAIQKRMEAGTAQAFDNMQGREEAPPRAEVRDGVAHIQIAGPILKSVPSVFEMFGIQATSTEVVREMLAAAVEDPAVKSIVLDVDSPGGTIEGVAELAGDVRAARDLKPVHAHASDLMASAAYWIGCQAGSVSCGPTAAVGSIGVYSVMEDTSAVSEKRGVKIHVIASHPLKGAGVKGSAITDDQLADAQRVINSYAGLFAHAVADGRGVPIEEASAVATGQVWIGDECSSIGLVDCIESASSAHKRQASGRTHERTHRSPQISIAPASAVQQESNMLTPEQIAAQAAENARLKAELETHKAQAKAMEHASKIALLDKYADRFMPAARPAFEGLAEHMDLAGFEGHLKQLPSVGKRIETPIPGVTEAARRLAGNGLASLQGFDPFTREPVGGQAGAEQVAKLLGTSVDAIDRYADVECGYSNGTFKMRDGRVVTAAELKKMKAA